MNPKNEIACNSRETTGLNKLFSRIPLSRLDYGLVFIVFLVSLIGALCGEKITVNEGLGFDGFFYGELAKRFAPKIFFSPGSYDLTSYTIQRIIPSAIVNFTLRIVHLKFTTANVIMGFALLNVIALTGSSIAWCLICRKMKITFTGKIVGFLGMFGSFALTKWVSFYPVLTDATAFALSIWILYFYLSNNKLLLALLTIVGAFTWSTLLYEGAIFLLFPKETSDVEINSSPIPYRLNTWIALVSSVALAVILQYVATHYIPTIAVLPNKDLLFISILMAALCWFFSLDHLLYDNQIFTLKYWRKFFFSLHWLPVLFIGIVIKVTQRLVSVPDTNTSQYLINHLISTIDMPGKFITAHIFFFGPIMLIALFWLGPIVRFMRAQGLGLVLTIILGLFFFLTSESRVMINFLPIIILGISHVTSSLRLRPAILYFFTILTIIFSRIWLPLNNTPEISHFISSLPSNLLGENIAPDYPLNIFYWASTGPWTTHQMYLIETVIAAIIGCILYFTMGRYCINPHTASSPSDQ